MAKSNSPRKLNPEKLRTWFLTGVTPADPIVPRRYTLTHSDRTGRMVLGIGSDYNFAQIRGWRARHNRDEVRAEWRHAEGGGYDFHVFVLVSGRGVWGKASVRNESFRKELPLAMSAMCFGDQYFLRVHPELLDSPVWVHFESNTEAYQNLENWGIVRDYHRVELFR